jgi:hypothetical protein
VKLNTLPDTATIVASRQKIDFYLWKGIPVARRWPRYTPYEHSSRQVLGMNRFRVAAKATGAISSRVQEPMMALHAGAGVTWIDHFRALAVGKPWIYLVV